MGYKQKSGILQRAGYDKDATSPFPQKTDSTSGDKLPSYNVTTYDASASASGGGSSSSSNSSSQNLSTDNLAKRKSTLKDLGSNFKPTKEQTAAANAEVARLKALDAKNAAALPISSGFPNLLAGVLPNILASRSGSFLMALSIILDSINPGAMLLNRIPV